MSSKRKTVDSVVSTAGKVSATAASGSGDPKERTAVKRQRVSRACDQCRAAREKCDGIQPLCFPCASQNRPCTYQANPKKRGVQTGYIRTLELAFAWVFEKVPGSEDALDSLLNHEGGQGRRLLTGSESAAANRLHQKWRRSRVHRDIDRILSGGESMPPEDGKSPSLDEASDTDGEADNSSVLPPGPESSGRFSHLSPTSRHTYSSSVSEQRQQGDDGRGTERAAVSAFVPPSIASPATSCGLRLPSNHWRLMDIYFSYTHCWLPILEKQEMFQASYLYSAEQGLDLSPSDPSTGIHAELWSALALASFQDAASSSPSVAEQGVGSGGMTPMQIYNVARSMIPTEDGPFQIHHTRALLLLSLVNLGRENLMSSWQLVGMAVRILLDVCASDGDDIQKQQRRPRSVFIACFIMDTMVSEQYHKPPHLTAEDMAEAMNISENDLDEWQPWAACEGFGRGGDNAQSSRTPAYSLSTFNQLYDIFKVISRNIATRRAGTGHDPRTTTTRVQLREAINLRAPFGTYILSSTESAPAPVPSPYVLKILYLWAMGLVDSISGSKVTLITGVIEQFQSRFGICAMPPFIAACFASWTSRPEFDSLDQQDRTRVAALSQSYASLWKAQPAASSSGMQNRRPTHNALTYRVNETAHHPNPMLTSIGSSITFPRPTPSYSSSVLMDDSPSPSHGRHDLNSTYAFPLYANARGLLSPAGTVIASDTSHDTINSLESTMAAQAAAASHLQTQYHMAPQPSMSVAGADYDALLDDLASIDYADRLEADPQFMVNLGFAPGCDMNEVMSLDFARF